MAKSRTESRHPIAPYPVSQRIDRLWPSQLPTILRAVILVAGAVALLTLSAKIKVPFYPVPMTLQTLTIGVIAAALGSRLSVLAVATYVACGIAGLPVFTNTPPSLPGLAYVMGPTGGYLVGFLVAAALVGSLCERGWARSFGTLWLAMLAGDLTILGLGVSWLSWGGMLLTSSPSIGLSKAMTLGFYPFILSALLKELLGAAIITSFASKTRLR
jgi:biotin transport system substrate-specific component